MKTLTILWATILMASHLYSQDAKEVLLKSRTAMSQIDNGYYEMDVYFKSVVDKDTSHRIVGYSYLMRNPDDSLMPWYYLSKYNVQDYLEFVRIYDGKQLIKSTSSYSTSEVIDAAKWPNIIKSEMMESEIVYYPIMDPSNYPLPSDSVLALSGKDFTFIQQEKIGEDLCYLIRSEQIPNYEGNDLAIAAIKAVTNYWIRLSDYMLIQYDDAVDVDIDSDTMTQYQRFRIKNFQFNYLKDKSFLSLDSLPESYVFKEYEPYVARESQFLDIGVQAPTWKFETLTDDSLSLEDLKGELVIMDFFYKGCFPCMKAIPALQSVYDKYKERGVVVIGVNPFDDKIEDELVPFMAKRGVTYPVVMANHDFAKSYKVMGYPTFYILDEDGRIIKRHAGYSAELEQELETFILEYFDK
jgi:peroxiredoxin